MNEPIPSVLQHKTLVTILAGAVVFAVLVLVGVVYFALSPRSYPTDSITEAQDAYNANQFADAIKTSESLLAKDPNNVNALLSLATTWAQRGAFEFKTGPDGDTALSYVQKVLALEPNNAEAYRVMGYVYETRGDYKTAQDTYLKALGLATNPGLLYLDLGRISEAQGDTAGAYAYYLKAQAAGTNPGVTYLSVGRMQMQEASATSTIQAKESLGRAEIWAENVRIKAEATYLLGTIALTEKDFTTAQTEMQKSISYDSTYALAHVGLAETYVRSLPGLSSENERSATVKLALKELDTAVNINPDQTLAYVLTGEIESGIGNTQQALAAFAKAKDALSRDRSLTEQGKANLQAVITTAMGSSASAKTGGVAGIPAKELIASGGGDFTIACPDPDCGIIVPPTVTTTSTTTVTTTVADTGTTVAAACVPPTTTTTTTTTNTDAEGYRLSDRTITLPGFGSGSGSSQYASLGAFGQGGPAGCDATKHTGGRGGGGGTTYQGCTATLENAQYLCEAKGYVWGVDSYTTSPDTLAVTTCTRAPQYDNRQGQQKSINNQLTSGQNTNSQATTTQSIDWSNVDGSAWLCTTQAKNAGGSRFSGSAQPKGTLPQMDTVVCSAPPQGTFFIGNECRGGQCLWGNNPDKVSEAANRKSSWDNTSTYLCRMRGYETFVDYWSRPKTSTRQGNASPLVTPYPPTTPMTPAQIMAAAPNEVRIGGDDSCTSNCWYRIGVVTCKLPTGSYSSSSSQTDQPASCNLPVTAKLTANKNTVASGSPVTLSYTSSNATSCAIDQGIGTLASAVSGSKTVSPQQNTTYVLTCTGLGGVAVDRQTITVTSAPPTVGFAAAPTSISIGGSSALTWNSTNATSCTGTGFPTGGATSGTYTVSPSETSNYSVSCANANGSTVKNATVAVLEPSTSISTSVSRVKSGDTVTVYWGADNVNSCTVSGPGLSKTVTADASGSLSGQADVVVTGQSTFIISCTPSGASSQSAAVVSLAPNFQEF